MIGVGMRCILQLKAFVQKLVDACFGDLIVARQDFFEDAPVFSQGIIDISDIIGVSWF